MEMFDDILFFGGEKMAEVTTPGEKFDEGVFTAQRSVSVDKKTYKYYPWGKDNKLPHRMLALVRSNGDVANLLETRADFLYGSGIGLFVRNEKNEVEPIYLEAVKEFWAKHEMDDFVDAAITQIVFTGHAFANISSDTKKKLSFNVKDSLTVRAVEVPEDQGKISVYLLSSKWDAGSQTKKAAVPVPAFDYADIYGLPESICNLHKAQPGQFYYNHPQWWSLEEWIKLANRIARIYNNSLDTEGNIGMIMRVAQRYFDDIVASNTKEDGTSYTMQEVKDLFKQKVDKFLFGTEKNKVLFDICGLSDKGVLEKYIEFEPVKKSLTGEEYNKLYMAAVQAIANASGVLGGLSGVSDGKMNSGGGTEITATAKYQQFFRTPRERKLIVNFLNKVFLKYMKDQKVKMPEGAFFDFKNILLETLDKNPTGMQTVKQSGSN